MAYWPDLTTVRDYVLVGKTLWTGTRLECAVREGRPQVKVLYSDQGPFFNKVLWVERADAHRFSEHSDKTHPTRLVPT